MYDNIVPAVPMYTNERHRELSADTILQLVKCNLTSCLEVLYKRCRGRMASTLRSRSKSERPFTTARHRSKLRDISRSNHENRGHSSPLCAQPTTSSSTL